MQCTKCNDIVQSKSVHDFVKCKCGLSFIDGGAEYTRCGGFIAPWRKPRITNGPRKPRTAKPKKKLARKNPTRSAA
jgi:hypothetical protein